MPVLEVPKLCKTLQYKQIVIKKFKLFVNKFSPLKQSLLLSTMFPLVVNFVNNCFQMQQFHSKFKIQQKFLSQNI